MIAIRLMACTLVLQVGILGCRDRSHSHPAPNKPAAQPSTATASTASTVDAWLGRWDGPEDTYLQLSRKGAQYVVTIKDLDGVTTYPGEVDGNRLRFLRNGKVELITAGDGEAAGMKWLLSKKHCLLTRKGEGWCRD